MGYKRPRQYWQKYGIQLTIEIANWLSPAARHATHGRLANHNVFYDR